MSQEIPRHSTEKPITGGIYKRELPATPHYPKLSYLTAGLSDTDQFDPMRFDEVVKEVIPSDNKEFKFIVTREPADKDKTADVLYAFPDATMHQSFYLRLAREKGYNPLQSAGFVFSRPVPESERTLYVLSGRSESLKNRLPYEQSDAYKVDVLAPKLKPKGFSIFE